MTIFESFGPIILKLTPGIGTFIFILLLTPIATKIGLLDVPDQRKSHATAVPMVGGLAIYLVIASTVLLVEPHEKLSWIILAVSIVVASGLLDDFFQLGVRVRLVLQIVASWVLFFGVDLWIWSIGVDFWFFTQIPSWIGIPITLFAVVGLTNAFNMVDGIDGLASGHMLVGLGSVCLSLIFLYGEVYQSDWVLLLISAVTGFLLVNLSLTPLKRVFLGDAGSLMLGFLMAFVLIYYTQDPVNLLNPIAALWCVTVPVFDTLLVAYRRLREKRSVFSPDRKHFHHLLVDMGMQPRLALMLILLVSLILNACGLLIVYGISPLMGLLAYFAFMYAFAYWILHPSLVRVLAKKLHLLDL